MNFFQWKKKRSFVDRFLKAGLLTKDTRAKERKKPGQEGARRKYTWFGIYLEFQFHFIKFLLFVVIFQEKEIKSPRSES